MAKAHIERRKRDIVRIKEQIIQAARKLARKNGWQGVSIRNIAEIIEYTPPVIYEHYKNKEAILTALEDKGFSLLSTNLEQARMKGENPQDQLLSLSEAYWNFAFEHPDLYQVMFNLQGIQSTPPHTEALRTAGKSVLDCLQYLHTFPAERERLFFSWWALSHGYVSMWMSGQVPLSKDTLYEHYLAGVRDFMKGLS